MNAEIICGPKRIEFPLNLTANELFLPFVNKWCLNSYFHTTPFDYDINEVEAASTSGSPVVIAQDNFWGFLCNRGGRVRFDGEKIVFHIPDTQKLIIINTGSEQEWWKEYNQNVEFDEKVVQKNYPHFYLPEYCTWVEQKYEAVNTRFSETPEDVICEDFVIKFLDRVDKMKLPRGKVTIDAGWQKINPENGKWIPDPNKFPSMEKMAKEIISRGHFPGLWFGLPKIQKENLFVSKNPDLFLLDRVNFKGYEERSINGGWVFHKPSSQLIDYYKRIFIPYVEMGFMKLKLDFYYDTRKNSIGQIRCANKAIRSLNPSIEIECHHPDIFFSRYLDVVRVNDMNVTPNRDWMGVVLNHIRVCDLSCPDRLLNYDHIGGNNPQVSEKDYLLHARMLSLYKNRPGYPVVSFLPDHFGNYTVEVIKDLLDKKE